MSAQVIPRIPVLQHGDRLTVEEFERRYEAMPYVKKAELIEGVVFMPSPVTQEEHGGPHFDLITWMGFYRAHTAGVEGGDNSSLRLKLGLSMPQPDAFLRILAECGGQSRIGKDGFVLGAPETVGEVAASSVSYDLHDKLAGYQRNGVLEYVVWRVLDRAIDWFYLRGGTFKRLPRSRDGTYKSKVFPGLWLDPAALVNRDLATVLHVVQKGLATAEHRRFVTKLRRWKEQN